MCTYYCHRVTTQLQLTDISYISFILLWRSWFETCLSAFRFFVIRRTFLEIVRVYFGFQVKALLVCMMCLYRVSGCVSEWYKHLTGGAQLRRVKIFSR